MNSGVRASGEKLEFRAPRPCFTQWLAKGKRAVTVVILVRIHRISTSPRSSGITALATASPTGMVVSKGEASSSPSSWGGIRLSAESWRSLLICFAYGASSIVISLVYKALLR